MKVAGLSEVIPEQIPSTPPGPKAWSARDFLKQPVTLGVVFALMASINALALAFVSGVFAYLAGQVDKAETRVSGQIVAVEQRVGARIDELGKRIDARFADTDKRTDARFEKLETEVAAMRVDVAAIRALLEKRR